MATGRDTAEQFSAGGPDACAATGEHSSAPSPAAATATKDRRRIRRRGGRNERGVPGDMADHPFGVSSAFFAERRSRLAHLVLRASR
jgi:hypothetical protein